MDGFGKNPVSSYALLVFFILHSSVFFCHGAFSITQGQFLRESQTLISENQHFELGFFSPSNSSRRYVGIWYHNIQQQTVIWVANRGNPISDQAGALTVGDDGNLIVLDGNNNTVWSSNASISTSNSTEAKLTDAGKLILSTGSNPSRDYWSSFEHPTDSFLPGMRVLVNAATGENRAFTSWKSESDPSIGNYSVGVDPRGSPQLVIWEGRTRKWRSGHWDSQKFIGLPDMSASLLYGFALSVPDEEGNRYFTYTPLNSSDYLRFKILWNGQEEQLRWEQNLQQWTVMRVQPSGECELYNICGNFAFCTKSNSPKCSCIDGFVPKNSNQWDNGNWSGGCVRRTPLLCQRTSSNGTEQDNEEDGFSTMNGLKLPEFVDLVVVGYNETCRAKCLANCSCTAYADVKGIGCMIWSGELIDMQHFDDAGSSLNIRLAHSEIGNKKKRTTTVVIAASIAGAVFLAIVIGLLWRYREKLKGLPASSSTGCWKGGELPVYDVSKSRDFSEFSGPSDLGIEGDDANGPELQFYTFSCVAAATDNFSDKSKLGEGGFGPVYKGMLPGGKDIAVKRLSVRSGQGLEEFKNEITLIAKLQHRNLVRLLGYCVQGEEKMLLYEYMPNNSLDRFIFGDSSQQAFLDWATRFKIIEGIARGLLYLHRDSRLRIIHRDLKASNILLDEDMNPKISDFGMARIFGANEDEANTNRVVGTYGYMAPEYAMEGLFSVKSDVYSFGVLLLEIVCGRRNSSFRMSDHSSLISHAWHLWNERTPMDLLDSSIREASSSSNDEVLRCIHVGILCVQDSPVSRPTMSSVVLMLESESTSRPLPRQPTYTSIRNSDDIEQFTDGIENVSSTSNDMTSTMIIGR